MDIKSHCKYERKLRHACTKRLGQLIAMECKECTNELINE